MSGSIVNVYVSQTQAPTPSTLQRTAAFVCSSGSFVIPPYSPTLITSVADLAPLYVGPFNTTSVVLSGGTVTVTVSGGLLGTQVGEAINFTMAGIVPAAYNGNYVCTITSGTTFTYPLPGSPGSVTTQGTVTYTSYIEAIAVATTWFAQGSNLAFYLFKVDTTTNVTSQVGELATWLSANPGIIYNFMVPREWDANSAFLALLASYESATAKTYFWITTTTNNYTAYTSLEKCAVCLVEAPNIPVTEFSIAAACYAATNYNPSPVNLVTPFAFTELSGVTPYPTTGNAALLAAFKTAHVNYIGTGAAGGITNTILLWGTTMDGNDFTYWYSVDWVQINIDLNLTNEIINGSNNPQNPLYYNQAGITRLQVRAQATMNTGTAYGLVLPPATVTAVPFATYVQEAPGDYKIGKYAGLAVTYTPQRGFTEVDFYVTVSGFPLS